MHQLLFKYYSMENEFTAVRRKNTGRYRHTGRYWPGVLACYTVLASPSLPPVQAGPGVDRKFVSIT